VEILICLWWIVLYLPLMWNFNCRNFLMQFLHFVDMQFLTLWLQASTQYILGLRVPYHRSTNFLGKIMSNQLIPWPAPGICQVG
jgi:hypothetical protein